MCGPLTAECLQQIESACGFCAGSGTTCCPHCAGKGYQLGLVTCPLCNGKCEADCRYCKGTGKVKCKTCGGDGTVTKQEGNGTFKRPVERPCPTCGNPAANIKGSGYVRCTKCTSGKVTCPKCKGTGRVEDKVPCPHCQKGVITCPACRGAGTRDAMLPEKRRKAEQEAAEQTGATP